MSTTLHKVPGTSLYINHPPADDEYRRRFTTFCFLAKTADPRTVLSLADTENMVGAYAFAGESPDAGWPALQQLLSGYTATKTLLWTRDWNTADHVLRFAGNATAAELRLDLATFELLIAGPYTKGELSAYVAQHAACSFEDATMTLRHADNAFAFELGGHRESAPLEDGKLVLVLEAGPACGAVQCLLAGQDGARVLDFLTPQVQYQFERDGWTELRSSRVLADAVPLSAHVPLFVCLNRDSQALARSRIAFADRDSRLALQFADTKGHDIVVGPAERAAVYFDTKSGSYASLVGQFAVLQPGTSDALQDGTSTCELIVGASGTEFFQLGVNGYDGIEFVAGQAAFAVLPTADVQGSLTDTCTTSWIKPCRTAPGVVADAGYAYVAQPQEQPLFGRRTVETQVGGMHSNLLAFDRAATLVTGDVCMPFVPLRGALPGKIAEMHEIDAALLAGQRAQFAAGSAHRTASLLADDELPWITTPQGLLVEVDPDNRWRRIRLGAGKAGLVDWKLTLERPRHNYGDYVERWSIQEALSRPEVFTVITRRSVDGAPRPADPVIGKIDLSVKLSDWGLDFALDIGPDSLALDEPARDAKEDPKPGSAFAPVMIFKLSPGRLDELVLDPGKWALGPVFNDDLGEAAHSAQGALRNLELLGQGISPHVTDGQGGNIPAESAKFYKSLYDHITDAGWTGVLVFNAEAPFTALPKPLKVLAEDNFKETGEDDAPSDSRDSFGVPVLGIDLSKVSIDGKALKIDKTSVFAAVHYHSPAPLSDTVADTNFAFKLRALNVVFGKSTLLSCIASMQLRVPSLLGTETVPGKEGAGRLVDIQGRYERKDVNSDEKAYVFRALGKRRLTFKDNPFLSHVTIERIDVASEESGASGKVTSRFALGGEIGFGPSFVQVTSVETVAFGSIALVMTEKRFSVDVKDVKVDLAKRKDGANQGWLANFPLQLSALRWSGFSIGSAQPLAPLTLAKAGFTRLGLALADIGDAFDFAIEFDLNLGSLGKLAEAMQFLKAKVLIGWTDGGRAAPGHKHGFTVGFRFDGGAAPLDIGINGVLRLRADEVSLKSYDKPAGIGIGLLRPQLEVMGYKIPDRPDDTLIVFMPKKDSGAKPPVSGTELAWLWARCATTVGPLELDFFAIGQRMRMVSEALPVQASLKEIIASAQDALRPEITDGELKLPNIGKQYLADAGWGVVARGKVGPLGMRFVFLDGLGRYGLGLDIPAVAKVDITYRKVGDSVGVFSGEITPEFRSLEMGAANVTLPIVNFDAYTNGNWSLNIGYNGNDFSRGITVQFLPFLGSGGIRFGRLDWRTSYVLNVPGARTDLYKKLELDPVIEMSFALRVGVGKEYENGIFKAGFTVSVYGIFEGAFGKPRDPLFPDTYPKRYLRLSGRAGLLIELYGSVNFALVSAAVHIRAWMEFGLLLETWVPITFSAELGVSVHVRFVIARVRIFGKRFEIAVNYHFAMALRAEFALEQTFDGTIPDVYKPYVPRLSALAGEPDEALRLAPLAWTFQASVQPRRTIPVGVTFEALVADGAPALVPMLLALQVGGRLPGLEAFCFDLLRWALWLSLGHEPDSVSLEEIKTLASRVTPPRGVSLARWGDQGLDYATLRRFFEDRIALRLQSPSDLHAIGRKISEQLGLAAVADDKPHGVALPWFADIGVAVVQSDGSVAPVRDFRGAHATTVSAEWERALAELLARAAPDYPESDSSRKKRERLALGLDAFQAESKQAMDVVVEDWAAALVQGIVQRAVDVLGKLKTEEHPNPAMTFADLLDKLAGDDKGRPCAQTIQQAGTFLNYGLRVPASDGAGRAVVLVEFLRTQIGFAELARHGKECRLAFGVHAGCAGGWILDEVRLDAFDLGAAGNALQTAHAQVKIKLDVMLDDDAPDATAARRFAADIRVPLTRVGEGAPSLHFASIPKALARIAAANAVKVEVYRMDDHGEQAVTGRWAVKIDLRVMPFASEAAGSPAAKGTYTIVGVDPRVRDLLAWMGKDGTRGSVLARLAYAAPAPAGSGSVQKAPVFLDGDAAYFFVANLSTENAPPHALLSSDGRETAPTFARLDDAFALMRILSMASRVNGPGFSLAFGVQDPLADTLQKDQVATLSVLFDVGDAAALLTGLVDGLLLDAAAVGDDGSIGFRTPELPEARTCAPDGLVAIQVERDNPDYAPAPADSPLADVQAIAAQYALVDYWTLPGAAVDLPRESVVPVRAHVEQHEVALLAEGPPRWRHRLALPVAKMAHARLVAEALVAGAPLPANAVPNPYALVGVDLRSLVQVGLRDGMGHILPADRQDITWAGGRILYRDFVPVLDELPGVALGWTVERIGDRAALTVDCAWSPTGIAEGASPEQIAQRLATWRDQYRKLLPVFEGRGFGALAQVTLGDHELGNLSVLGDLNAWLRDIVRELGDTGRAPVPCRCAPLRVDLDLGHLPAQTPKPLALRVRVELTRDPALCPAGDMHLAVRRASTPVTPAASGAGIDWPLLLAGLTRAFDGRLALLKRIDSATRDAVWLIASAMLPKSTLLVASSTFAAPTPLAKTFRSGSVEVRRYNDEAIQVDASDIDLNAVAGRAAAAIEALLRPDTGTTLARLSDAAYGHLTTTKHVFAQAMADRLANVLETDAPAPSEDAAEKFLNACRADARAAFAPTVLVTMHQAHPGKGSVFLYGAMHIEAADPDARVQYSMTPIRVPADVDGPCGDFDFIVRWTDSGSTPAAALSGALHFAPQYVEVAGNADAPDGAPSDWYEIVWPDVPAERKRLAVTHAGRGKQDWTIPLPLRLVPPAPVIVYQKLARDPAPPARDLATFVRQARTWRYVVAFGTANADQDVATATVRFADKPMAFTAPDTALFEALVAFGYHEEEILRLVGALRDGGAGVAVGTAGFYIDILETLGDCLATAAMARTAAPLLPAQERIVTLDAATNAPTWRLGWKVDPPEHRQSVTCRLLAYPDKDNEEARELPPDALGSTDEGYAEYRLAGDVLAAKDGLVGLSLRSVSIAGLDVLRHAGASAEVKSRRNAGLLKDGPAIASAFVFETPTAYSVETLAPHLASDAAFDVTTGAPRAEPLAYWMARLADALFDGVERSLYTLDLSAHLRMPLAGADAGPAERVDILYPLPSIKGAGAGDGSALAVLASHVTTHLQGVEPAVRQYTTLELRVHVYPAAGAQQDQPVLSLTGLYLPLARLA